MLPFVISLMPAVNPGHAFRVDPGHARNITVYHVNEHKYGAIPLNMNTADVNTADVISSLIFSRSSSRRSRAPTRRARRNQVPTRVRIRKPSART